MRFMKKGLYLAFRKKATRQLNPNQKPLKYVRQNYNFLKYCRGIAGWGFFYYITGLQPRIQSNGKILYIGSAHVVGKI